MSVLGKKKGRRTVTRGAFTNEVLEEFYVYRGDFFLFALSNISKNTDNAQIIQSTFVLMTAREKWEKFYLWVLCSFSVVEALCCVGNCVPLGAELQVELGVSPLKGNNNPACSTVGRKAHWYNPPNVFLLQCSHWTWHAPNWQGGWHY